MSEVSFTKQYLGTLDGRPVRFSRDYVQDPRRLPAQSAYILPRIANPPPKRTKLAPGAELNVNEAGTQNPVDVVLKTLRASDAIPSIVLRNVSRYTSVYDLKALAGNQTGYEPGKIKLLWDKKPLQDSKVLRDILNTASQEDQVELGIMFVGQPTVKADTSAGCESPRSGSIVAPARSSSESILEGDDFWSDLRKFIVQRLSDEDYGNILASQFRTSWARHRTG